MPILLYIHNYKYVYYCLLLIHMTSQAQTLPVHYTYTCQHYCTCLYDAYAYMPMHAYTLPIHLIPTCLYLPIPILYMPVHCLYACVA